VAKQSPDDLAFQHWIEWVFDHPVTNPEWYQAENVEFWVASPVVTVDYITRLFEAAPTHLQEFSDAQASQGLWFLASSIFFEGLSRLYSEGVLRSQRQRCIRSMYTLFEEYFAVRCSPDPPRDDKADDNPLDGTCFMWWDFLAHYAETPEGRIGTDTDSDMLSTMERILRLNQDACTESALHGLGHWQHFCPADVAGIIDGFLASTPHLRQELRTYALDARAGRVL
jgi:hypothetical protein